MSTIVAISFAGEQRTEGRAIANCLQPEIRVFFDEYEQASLWGKNLYEHLADLYHRKARYCLMLVSKAYAEKVWPPHERRSAQARALQEKQEYILPVRFDNTDVPGILPTVCYVSFKDYGPEGICKLVRQKLGNQVVEPVFSQVVRTSRQVMFLDPRNKTQTWIPATGGSWSSEGATLFLVPEEESDQAFLNELRGSRTELIVAYKQNFASCRPKGVTHIHKEGIDQWELELQVGTADPDHGVEINFQTLSADQMAEQRARRILLNEHLSLKSNDINQRMIESFISGSGGQLPLSIEGSPFPDLFRQFSYDPTKFLEIAWVTASMLLKVSSTVAEVTELQLALNANDLQVRFSGKRRKQYANHPAATISFTGVCRLL